MVESIEKEQDYGTRTTRELCMNKDSNCHSDIFLTCN